MFVLVFRNRLSVRKFIKKVAGKGKVVVVSTTLGVVIFFSRMETAHGMGLSPIPQTPIPIGRILSNKDSYTKFASIPPTKVDKIRLTNEQIEDLHLICYKLQKGSITIDKAILELRAGGFYDWATLAFIIFMYRLHQGNSFQNVPLPHQDPFGWLNGKYDPKPMQNTSYKSSRFELEMAGVNDNMCSGLPMADEEGFIMSYEEARNLVAETYPGYLQVDESCRITDWQAAKHSYHAKGMGIDPADYGFTQHELERIRGEQRYKEGGLIAYARRGYRLPPIEMVRDYESRLKKSCDQSSIRKNITYYDKYGAWKSKAFAIPPSENSSATIIAFNISTGELITGDKQRKGTFDRFNDKDYLGSKKWMLKWSRN